MNPPLVSDFLLLLLGTLRKRQIYGETQFYDGFEPMHWSFRRRKFTTVIGLFTENLAQKLNPRQKLSVLKYITP